MISCHQHDYIEISCVYRYLIRLTLRSGSKLDGIAIDTQLNDKQEECIKVDVDGVDQLIVLDSIHKMEVLTENPHFNQVIFD